MSCRFDLNPEHRLPGKRVVAAQESFVVEYQASDSSVGYLYVGGRWTSARPPEVTRSAVLVPARVHDTLTPPLPALDRQLHHQRGPVRPVRPHGPWGEFLGLARVKHVYLSPHHFYFTG